MFSECDNCNENDFATKLFTTDIHKFKFLHLFEKITLNFTSRGQESGPGFVSALIYGFIQVNWPPEPLVSPLWDNKNSIHPGSKARNFDVDIYIYESDFDLMNHQILMIPLSVPFLSFPSGVSSS